MLGMDIVHSLRPPRHGGRPLAWSQSIFMAKRWEKLLIDWGTSVTQSRVGGIDDKMSSRLSDWLLSSDPHCTWNNIWTFVAVVFSRLLPVLLSSDIKLLGPGASGLLGIHVELVIAVPASIHRSHRLTHSVVFSLSIVKGTNCSHG